MKITYWRDTDTMRLVFREDLDGYDSEEVAPGVVVDFAESAFSEVHDHTRRNLLRVVAIEVFPEHEAHGVGVSPVRYLHHPTPCFASAPCA